MNDYLERDRDSSNLHSIAHTFEAKNLIVAREFRGLLKKELAAKLNVSPSAITQWEAGRTNPGTAALANLSLILNFPATFFNANASEDISSDRCHFRSLRSSSLQERLKMIASSILIARLVAYLEDNFVKFPIEKTSSLQLPHIEDVRAIDELADKARAHWGLGQGPIPNIVALLESGGVVVARLLKSCEKVDAFSVVHRHRPFIFLNTEKSNPYRSRFDAAHELGHLIMHADCSPGNPIYEAAADRFASAFIFPSSSFKREFPGRLNWEHLIELKERWGMSLAAILRRAFDLSQISRATYTRGNIFLRQTKLDFEPGRLQLEQPTLISKALALLSEKQIALSSLASALSVREQDLKEIMSMDASETS